MNFTSQSQQQHPRQPTTGLILVRTHQASIVTTAVSCDYACLMSPNKDNRVRGCL